MAASIWKALGLGVLVAANIGAACDGGGDDDNNTDTTNNTTTTNNTDTSGGTTSTPNNTDPGNGEIGVWEGDGTCIGGGGDQFMGTYRVVIDGTPTGPFSVWGVGAEASTFTLIGCHGIGGCARGQCWPNIGVNIVFKNFALGDTPLVGERELGTHLVVKYGDTTTDPDIAETGAMGTATVTAWDFISQQFSGTVDVTTETGRSIQIEFDVDGTDLM